MSATADLSQVDSSQSDKQDEGAVHMSQVDSLGNIKTTTKEDIATKTRNVEKENVDHLGWVDGVRKKVIMWSIQLELS